MTTPANPLNDVLPERVRKYVYALLFVAATVFALYQASQGDWLLFTGSLLTALTGLLANNNTAVKT